MNGELFKNKSLKFAVNLKVHTERLAMLYNYYFFSLGRRRRRRLHFTPKLDAKVCSGGEAVEEKWLNQSNKYACKRRQQQREQMLSACTYV